MMKRGTTEINLFDGNNKFWGVYKGEGKNMLGKLLMKVRKELSDVDSVRKW